MLALASNNISLDELPDELKNILDDYSGEILKKINEATKKTMTEFKKDTQAQKYDRDTGAYRKAMQIKVIDSRETTFTMQWSVKPPHYRLTHLLNDGHQTRNGGRTKAYHHIDKAIEKAEKTYTKRVTEALKG